MGRVRTFTKQQKEYSNWRVSEHRRKIKIKAIEHKGGKCEKCGYHKCTKALDFHHRDPKEKEFRISSGKSIGWEKTKKEIEKCDLLCSNCHREIHHEWDFKKWENMKQKVPDLLRRPKINTNCKYCSTQISVWPSRAKKYKNLFCNKECYFNYEKQTFGELISIDSKLRISKTKILWPEIEELKELVWKYPLTKLSKEFGVSDKSIIKRCRKFSIETPGVGYWNKVYANAPVV